jgi:hypothetical protein
MQFMITRAPLLTRASAYPEYRIGLYPNLGKKKSPEWSFFAPDDVDL